MTSRWAEVGPLRTTCLFHMAPSIITAEEHAEWCVTLAYNGILNTYLYVVHSLSMYHMTFFYLDRKSVV